VEEASLVERRSQKKPIVHLVLTVKRDETDSETRLKSASEIDNKKMGSNEEDGTN
jgi:hypothetical protein